MTKTLLRIFVAMVLSTLALVSSRAVAVVGVQLEPVVGYERVQQVYPTAHTTDRLIYGIRASAGFPLLSAEAQYNHGQDSESFPTQNIDTSDVSDEIKLGVRSALALGMISVHVRAGAEASQTMSTHTVSGIVSKSTTPIAYHPYLGAGADVRLGGRFSLRADLTTVFLNFPNMNANNYQLTAGFVVHLP